MHRTTIMLPRELKVRAERRAREDGVSLGEFVRRSVELSLGQPGEVAEDALFSDHALYDGEVPAGYSTDHDEYLYGDDG
jgi:hypothetical protein